MSFESPPQGTWGSEIFWYQEFLWHLETEGFLKIYYDAYELHGIDTKDSQVFVWIYSLRTLDEPAMYPDNFFITLGPLPHDHLS